MVLAFAQVERLAKYQEPGRPWAREAVSALQREAEERITDLAERALEHASRDGRRTVFARDVAAATRKPKPSDVYAYVDALESALHQVVEQARRAGLEVDVPALPRAPIREAS